MLKGLRQPDVSDCVTSCDLRVLVDETAESITSQNANVARRSWATPRSVVVERGRCSLVCDLAVWLWSPDLRTFRGGQSGGGAHV